MSAVKIANMILGNGEDNNKNEVVEAVKKAQADLQKQ